MKDIRKCENCRYNVSHDGNGFDYRYPCNQQNCWWAVIEEREESEEEE